MDHHNETESLLSDSGGMVHLMNLDDFYKKLDTNIKGLKRQSCKEKREIYGLNLIPAPVTLPSWLCCLLPCLSYSKDLAKFHDCIPDHSEVLRDDRWILLDTASIVPGDVVRIATNDRVPADIRIVEITGNENLSFDTWAITGNSDLKVCSATKCSNSYLDSENMIFAGYCCIEGSCLGVVVATGKNTTIARMITKSEWPPKK